MGSVRLLAFAGSLRAGSWNKKLISAAADMAEAAGAEVTRIDDAGHYIQEDAHEKVIPLLLDFLAK